MLGRLILKFLKRFFDGAQRDLRLFLFILFILELYRALFILEISALLDEIDRVAASADFNGIMDRLEIEFKNCGRGYCNIFFVCNFNRTNTTTKTCDRDFCVNDFFNAVYDEISILQSISLNLWNGSFARLK